MWNTSCWNIYWKSSEQSERKIVRIRETETTIEVKLKDLPATDIIDAQYG